MWRNIASNALSLLILVLLVAAGVLAWGQSQYNAQGPLAEAICLRVESGSTMRALSNELHERGAVDHSFLVRLGADYTGRSTELKAGSFLLPAGASPAEILDIVTRGGQSTCGTEIVYRIGINAMDVRIRELDPSSNRFAVLADFSLSDEAPPPEFQASRDRPDTRYRISVAEGATSWQVASALARIDILEGELTEIPPEGTLAPESYEVQQGATRGGLIQRMQDLQAERLSAAWENRAADLPVASAEEALILASIIEKETGVPEERDLVAAVFVNRLRRGMRLQTDPTVIYGITSGKEPLGRGLRRSELDAITEYNTYVIPGLPPTPIANPGAASIEAALDPANSDYVYFVADGTGGHAFATTLQQHNENVARWRKIETEQNNQ